MFHRIGGKVGISGGGLDLAVAEQFADHGKPLAVGHRDRGEGVTQVVDAHVLNSGALANALPR